MTLIRRLLELGWRIWARPPVEPPEPPVPDWVRPPAPHRVKVCRQHAPTEHPLTGSRTNLRLDPERPHVVAADGLLVQRAEVDLLLADGRMSRIGVLAAYDAATHEPRRISYVPIHELTESEVVP